MKDNATTKRSRCHLVLLRGRTFGDPAWPSLDSWEPSVARVFFGSAISLFFATGDTASEPRFIFPVTGGGATAAFAPTLRVAALTGPANVTKSYA